MDRCYSDGKPGKPGGRVGSYRAGSVIRRAVVVSVLAWEGISAQAPMNSPTMGQMHHTAWTITEGAPQVISEIAQSTDGYLWLATNTGLYRFDGVRFERFDLRIGDKPAPRDILSLHASSDGSLWIGYTYGGVGHLVGSRLRNYGEADGLPRGGMKEIVQDQDGVVWAASRTALSRFVEGRWRRVEATYAVPDTNIIGLLVDRRGSVWVSGPTGVYSLSRGANAFRYRAGPLGDGNSGTLRMAPDGSVWGVGETRGPTMLATAADSAPPASASSGSGAYSMLFDGAGNAWLAAIDGVRWVPRAELMESRVQTKSASRPPSPAREQFLTRKQGLSGNFATALLLDREGSVWVGTEVGLDRFRQSKLTHEDLGDHIVAPAMALADSGAMWIAGVTRPVMLYRQNRTTEFNIPKGIECAYRDATGAVWFGGRDGIWRVVGRTAERVRKPVGHDSAYVQSLAVDASKAFIVSLQRVGVFRRRVNDSWSLLSPALDSGRLSALIVTTDESGRTWLGYTKNRLVRITADDTARVFTTGDGLRIGNIWSIHVRGPHVWVGGDSGLVRLEGDRFTRIAPRDPDALHRITGIVETDDGELWINGVDGIGRISSAELSRTPGNSVLPVDVERFDFRDGITGYGIQLRPLPTAVQGADGRLWFANVNEVLTVDPRRVHRNRLPPPVRINSIATDGRVFELADTVVLPPHTRTLEIRYTALSLAIPERVRFRYQLIGSDTGWRDAGMRREAFYTNLQPGKYRFRVIAANEDGIWNDEGAATVIDIPPTFTQTNAFLALCAIGAGGALWLMLRWRQQQVAAAIRARYEVTLVERTRIAQELHDTLLQGFTGVSVQLYAVRKMLRTQPLKAEQTLDEALAYTDASLREARHAVWELRSPQLDALTLPEALAAAAREVVISSVELQCSVAGERRALPHDVEVAALRIGREAVMNAVKHADARLITLALTYDRRALSLVVTDDGRGFAPSDAETARSGGHWGIVGMRERAANIGGVLEVESAPGRGTRVALTLQTADAA